MHFVVILIYLMSFFLNHRLEPVV